MSRLDTRLAERRQAGRKVLVTFITAGDPQPEVTVPALHALVAGGADVLELGIPFSDPEAEGPAIQAASERGLAAGMTLRRVIGLVAEFRQQDQQTPVVLMGYLNSVLAMGCEAFAAAAAAAGVDGLIMVNLPPEECAELKSALDRQGLRLIFLVAPTTTEERARMILDHASGFVYYVSLKGTTGAASLDARAVGEKIRWLRGLTSLPLLVGFGIKDGSAARAASEFSDGVVVGSALVAIMAERAADPGSIPQALQRALEEIRNAMDAAPS